MEHFLGIVRVLGAGASGWKALACIRWREEEQIPWGAQTAFCRNLAAL
jgi:hypothetical protein